LPYLKNNCIKKQALVSSSDAALLLPLSRGGAVSRLKREAKRPVLVACGGIEPYRWKCLGPGQLSGLKPKDASLRKEAKTDEKTITVSSTCSHHPYVLPE
jgi:hypothetical protein